MERISKTILIVEDDTVARGVLTLILSKHFTSVETASNGQEGLELCEKFNPDLVLLDLAMPVLDGFLMIDVMKEKFPDILILVLTAFREEAGEIKESKVLYKPVDRKELLDAVASVLSVDIKS